MTFKKYKVSGIKKLTNKAQSIFEYLILTAVVATAVLFFAESKYFKDIKTSCENAFNGAVAEIVQ